MLLLDNADIPKRSCNDVLLHPFMGENYVLQPFGPLYESSQKGEGTSFFHLLVLQSTVKVELKKVRQPDIHLGVVETIWVSGPIVP